MTDDDGREIRHLTDLAVEHMLGQAHGPLVKFDASEAGGKGVTLRAQLSPAAARRVAGHLVEAAARAEYEADLVATMEAEGWEPGHIGAILMMVRQGEEDRLTKREEVASDG